MFLTFIFQTCSYTEISKHVAISLFVYSHIRYSEAGSNQREKEELTYIYSFVDHLEEYEDV